MMAAVCTNYPFELTDFNRRVYSSWLADWLSPGDYAQVLLRMSEPAGFCPSSILAVWSAGEYSGQYYMPCVNSVPTPGGLCAMHRMATPWVPPPPPEAPSLPPTKTQRTIVTALKQAGPRRNPPPRVPHGPEPVLRKRRFYASDPEPAVSVALTDTGELRVGGRVLPHPPQDVRLEAFD